MAVGIINTSKGMAETVSEEEFGRISTEVEIFSENDNGVDSSSRRSACTAGVDSVALIDLTAEITPSVEALLRKTLANRGKAEIEIADEDTLRVYLGQYRRGFDAIFDGTKYVHDLRVARLVRVFDYCYRVGFDCQDFFEERLNRGTSPEEAISTFRNFFRMSMIMITEQIDRPELVMKMKISGVKNPSDIVLAPASDLASTILGATKDRMDEIYAALVILKSGIIDQKQ